MLTDLKRDQLKLAIWATCVLGNGLCHAQPHDVPASSPPGSAPQSIASKAVADSLGGIVTNQTMTVGGQEFYSIFSALWHDKSVGDQYAIAIRERPSARRGTTVQVDYGNRTVFQAVLPTARGLIRAFSEQAVDISYERIVSIQVQNQLFQEQDLAPDEL